MHKAKPCLYLRLVNHFAMLQNSSFLRSLENAQDAVFRHACLAVIQRAGDDIDLQDYPVKVVARNIWQCSRVCTHQGRNSPHYPFHFAVLTLNRVANQERRDRSVKVFVLEQMCAREMNTMRATSTDNIVLSPHIMHIGTTDHTHQGEARGDVQPAREYSERSERRGRTA